MEQAAKKIEGQHSLVVEGGARELGELQFRTLSMVAGGDYNQASIFLEAFRKSKPAYKQFEIRAGRFFDHAQDLIKAIEAKKKFPNLHSLPQSKQDEIHAKALENWEDLKLSLRRVQQIEKDLLLEDSRSSIYVVRAILFSVSFLFMCFLINEAFRTIGKSFRVFMDDVVKLILSWF